MMEMLKKETSHEWWFDSHHRTANRSSSWLQSTLGELDMKTKAMLKLIEEDADSFAQRAEMYYKKRPELIGIVEDFYRAHRSLAERYDQLKSDSGNRLLTTLGSPFSAGHKGSPFSAGHKGSPFSAGHKGSPFSAGYQTEKLAGFMDQNYDTDSHSETYDQECAESEVDDPEQDDEMHADKEMEAEKDPKQTEESEEATGKSEEVSSALSEEIIKLRDEIEQLKEENKIQASKLLQKDEEKREVIRQLSSAMEMLKSESADLRKCLAKVSHQKTKLWGFEKFKGVFSGKFIKGTPNFQGSVVAL